MRSGAASGHVGYYHETGFYGSDDEFLALVVPFLTGGLDAGEPTMAAFTDPKTSLLRDALPDASALTFLRGDVQYDRPAATIRKYRRLITEQVANGARQIRVVGEVPHPGLGAPWSGWARYEAAVNHAYHDFPL